MRRLSEELGRLAGDSDDSKRSIVGNIDAVNYFFDPIHTVDGGYCPFSELWLNTVTLSEETS